MEAPILDSVSTEFYKAFGALSRSRGSMAQGQSLPITMEAIDVYARRYDIDDFEEFHTVIAGVDDCYLKEEAKHRVATQRKLERDRKRKNAGKTR